ncbi:MAG: secondary thiamine-phosphate synthase enzyme YjbQ [Mariprofundaceae bacterium]
MSVPILQHQHELQIRCQGRGMYDFTREIYAWMKQCGIEKGLLNLFICHTSCSMMIQENADPTVQEDMEAFLSRLVMDGDPIFRHRQEGSDDMSAHIRSALTSTSLTIPVCAGRLGLGTWQGIYLYEHRTHAMVRKVQLHLIGSA